MEKMFSVADAAYLSQSGKTVQSNGDCSCRGLTASDREIALATALARVSIALSSSLGSSTMSAGIEDIDDVQFGSVGDAAKAVGKHAEITGLSKDLACLKLVELAQKAESRRDSEAKKAIYKAIEILGC